MMRNMNYSKMVSLQKKHGYADLQKLINDGTAWLMEGAVGRSAMDALRCGACWLPKQSHRDYYGNHIPSRGMVKIGTLGSWLNSQTYYSKIAIVYYR